MLFHFKTDTNFGLAESLEFVNVVVVVAVVFVVTVAVVVVAIIFAVVAVPVVINADVTVEAVVVDALTVVVVVVIAVSVGVIIFAVVAVVVVSRCCVQDMPLFARFISSQMLMCHDFAVHAAATFFRTTLFRSKRVQNYLKSQCEFFWGTAKERTRLLMS